ncbi:hypothetical protein ACFU6M_41430 [Streptomyces bottropensis]|uniref:hypothetical protein n=1 Tax=Streptomyces bottropensis TaxID=42235 RepID=UPI00368F284B
MTMRLDRIAAAGTGEGYRRIRFADGGMITVEAEPDSTVFTEVALWPGLTAPSTEAWANEDSWELLLTDQDGEGRSLFVEVPVEAVREFIQEHGGEHADQDDDLPPVRHRVSPRSATGIYRIHLDDQGIGRIIRRDDYWLATPSGENRRSFDYDDFDAAAAYLVQEADIEAGRLTRASQDLGTALAPYGLTAVRAEDVLIGGSVLSWLVLDFGDPTQAADDEEPHLDIWFSDPDDGDEVTVDRPARASDRWVLELHSGSGQSIEGGSFPGLDVAAVAAYVARWHRDPHTAWDEAMAAFDARWPATS